jgi:GMP synthase (glutamine-hydrolysing)
MAILIFEHSDRTGAQRLGQILRNYGHRLRFIKLHRDDPFPVDLDDVDGIISCGGPQSANDDAVPWISQQMELMQLAHGREMPIVGLCLGSQILARALGGEVDRMGEGPEFGWHEIALTPAGREDPMHAGLPWKSIMAHFHHDAVTELPPGARLLASSTACRVQSWTAGLRTYGFQYHPEITANVLEDILADESTGYSAAGLSREALNQQTQQHFGAFERLTNRLFESIALLLMPVDRRYRGLVKDLHH